MHIRRPGEPDETPPPNPAPDAVSFQVPGGVPVAKTAVAVVLAVAALLTGERLTILVGVLTAVALIVFAVRDVLARERLRADRSGVDVVRGFASRRHLAWADIETFRIDERLRLGVRSRLLEVDADTEIYLFSRYDLGVDPGDAITAITALRPTP
jgi:Bacterial PH domain